MGYRFKGFFADADDAVLSAALQRWPFCTGQHIASPFRGIGVRCPDPEREAENDADYERVQELGYRVEDELAAFSAVFTGRTFVFVNVECFGGVCEYTGHVARAGQIVDAVREMEPGTENLQRLVNHLGVQLPSGYFAPFERGYWSGF